MKDVKFDGNKLLKARKNKNMSQEQLANIIGVSRQTIYLWESNQNLPDVEKVKKICDTLEIKMEDLFDGEISQKNEKILIKSKKKIIKYILFIIIILILVYFAIVNIKFIKLNKILKKWEKLNSYGNYYFEVTEYQLDNGKFSEDGIHYKKYLDNGVLKLLIENKETGEFEPVVISDFINNQKYYINHTEKTYTKEEIRKGESYKLINNLPIMLAFDNNNFINYLCCFNPNFNISNKGNWIITLDNDYEMVVNKDGIIQLEQFSDNNNYTSDYNRTYNIKVSTDETYNVDLNYYLENYTETK